MAPHFRQTTVALSVASERYLAKRAAMIRQLRNRKSIAAMYTQHAAWETIQWVYVEVLLLSSG